MVTLSRQLRRPVKARRGHGIVCLATVCRVVGILLVCVHVAADAQMATRRFGHSREMPTGAIGRQQLLRGGPLRGYFQPVRVSVPNGALVAPAVSGHFATDTGNSLMAGLLVGHAYRIRVTNIPFMDETEIYPSVEIIDRLFPPAGEEASFPIPIEITASELRAAATGGFVTRVIYVEDPDLALPFAETPQSEQRFFEVPAGDDPLVTAETLGRPVAILRIGSRIPETTGANEVFLFGSPPLQILAPPVTVTATSHHVASPTAAGVSAALPHAVAENRSTPSSRPVKQAVVFTISDRGPIRFRTGIPCPTDADDTLDCPPAPADVPRPRRRMTSRDEYLCDGGDQLPRARVDRDWRVDGLELTDTVAHFDTLSGRTEVVASNRVCVYAPRFAATRQIVNLEQNRSTVSATPWLARQQAAAYEELTETGTLNQPLGTVRQVGEALVQSLDETQKGLTVDQTHVPKGVGRRLLPHEGFEIVRTGVPSQAEAARLMSAVEAAREWTNLEAPQVILDGEPAALIASIQGANEFHQYEIRGQTRFRIVKLASTESAHTGDIVQFTIRFDNIGDEPVGNVTILDNLTTRLEYVAESQECSLKADFLADDNEGQSSMLRWEVIEPLPPGEGGVIRFQCRVR